MNTCKPKPPLNDRYITEMALKAYQSIKQSINVSLNFIKRCHKKVEILHLRKNYEFHQKIFGNS